MPTLQNGDAFPDLDLTVLGRGATRLSELARGAWTLVHLYRAEWCPTCQGYFARVAQARADITEAGLRIVAVSTDPEEKAQALRDRHDLWFPIAYGAPVTLAERLGTYSDRDKNILQPAFFLLDPEGRVRHVSIQSAGMARPAIEEFVAIVSYATRQQAA